MNNKNTVDDPLSTISPQELLTKIDCLFHNIRVAPKDQGRFDIRLIAASMLAQQYLDRVASVEGENRVSDEVIECYIAESSEVFDQPLTNPRELGVEP